MSDVSLKSKHLVYAICIAMGAGALCRVDMSSRTASDGDEKAWILKAVKAQNP